MSTKSETDVQLNVSEASLKNLYCSICRGYLSVSPLRLTADGDNICGRCSPLNRDFPVYRQHALESLMSDATFPCKYKHNGCNERLNFDYAMEHENLCLHRDSNSVEEEPQPGCSTQEDKNNDANNSEIKKQTFLLENVELRVEVDGDNKSFSVKNNGCRVINPFHPKNSSIASSVENLRNNLRDSQRRDSSASNRSTGSRQQDWGQNWERDRNYTSFDDGRNHYRPPGPWNNMPYTRAQYYSGQPYRKRFHRNNLVIIKGRTLYVTL